MALKQNNTKDVLAVMHNTYGTESENVKLIALLNKVKDCGPILGFLFNNNGNSVYSVERVALNKDTVLNIGSGEVALNRLEAIKLVASKEFNGQFANSRLRLKVAGNKIVSKLAEEGVEHILWFAHLTLPVESKAMLLSDYISEDDKEVYFLPKRVATKKTQDIFRTQKITNTTNLMSLFKK